MYNNEIDNNNIVLDEYREYSSSGLNGNFIVRDEYAFPYIKNGITNNEKGSGPFYFGMFEFWFDSKKDQLIWRINTFGSLESKSEYEAAKGLPQEDPPSINTSSDNVIMNEEYYRNEI